MIAASTVIQQVSFTVDETRNQNTRRNLDENKISIR